MVPAHSASQESAQRRKGEALALKTHIQVPALSLTSHGTLGKRFLTCQRCSLIHFRLGKEVELQYNKRPTPPASGLRQKAWWIQLKAPLLGPPLPTPLPVVASVLDLASSVPLRASILLLSLTLFTNARAIALCPGARCCTVQSPGELAQALLPRPTRESLTRIHLAWGASLSTRLSCWPGLTTSVLQFYRSRNWNHGKQPAASAQH